MLRVRITLPHFSVSSSMSLPKSAGEYASTSPPRSASRAFILGSARAALTSVLSLSTISAGVAFCADAEPDTRLVAGQDLADRRNIWQFLQACETGDRKCYECAGFDVVFRCRGGDEHNLHLSADEVGHGSRNAAIRDVNQVDTGHHLKQFTKDMRGTSDSARCHVDLARIGFRIGNELGQGLGWNRRVHDHDGWKSDDRSDRRDVANEIETEFLVERRVDGVRRASHEQRVAVRRRLHHRLGANVAAGAGPVLDDELLA